MPSRSCYLSPRRGFFLSCPVVHVFVLVPASASITQVCRLPDEVGRADGWHQAAERKHIHETAPIPCHFHHGPPPAGGAGGARQAGASRPCQQWHLVAHRQHEHTPVGPHSHPAQERQG